jgi:UDP-N-acetyl-D-glucosamine dehydrogenase
MEECYTSKRAIIGIVGLGYVGMPLACAAWKNGFRVVGFDVDDQKVAKLNAGESYLKQIPSVVVSSAVAAGHFRATCEFAEVENVNAIIICVPTPLTAHREPDLSYVERTTRSIAPYIRPGHLIVLESTTWPGTTAEVIKPIIEEHGLRSGRDFFLAYSPEREDPGNPSFSTEIIPKVVGADDPQAQALTEALYRSMICRAVPVSSTRAAEAVKLTENIFRAVNIALVNELKIVYREMGVDIWEVIEAASTKPFGFMPFYPGPGLGGHCIPIDPFYLTWKAREHGVPTKFIELAGEINTMMPKLVIEHLARELDARTGRGLRDARVLVLGMAYKRNVEDIRESPSLKLMELLEERGARVEFYDPYIPVIPNTREYPKLRGRSGMRWMPDRLADFEVALIATDHDCIDYSIICQRVPLIIDTRNVVARKGINAGNVVKA